jgi:hypothetical protein
MAHPDSDIPERLRRSKLDKYLLADEIPILAQHQHWAAFAKPVLFAIAGFFGVATLAIILPANLNAVTNVLVWAWIGLVLWAVWKWYLWKREWLVATDKRLLVNYGLVNQGVAMISLARVVDLTYTRSTFGQMFGYGTLERESQNRPHNLHRIRWVKDPHSTYLTICAAIFSLQDRMFGMDQDENYHHLEDGGPPPPHTPGLVASPSGAPSPEDSANQPDQIEDQPEIRIKYEPSRHDDQDSWQQSADLRESSLRDADTGPIPYRLSTTEESTWPPTHDDEDHDENHDNGPF